MRSTCLFFWAFSFYISLIFYLHLIATYCLWRYRLFDRFYTNHLWTCYCCQKMCWQHGSVQKHQIRVVKIVQFSHISHEMRVLQIIDRIACSCWISISRPYTSPIKFGEGVILSNMLIYYPRLYRIVIYINIEISTRKIKAHSSTEYGIPLLDQHVTWNCRQLSLGLPLSWRSINQNTVKSQERVSAYLKI